jgi:hypothetical protein
MWMPLGKLFSRSRTLNALFGDVIFTTPQVQGTYSRSFFEWRVKRSIDRTRIYIAVKMRADGSAGAEGAMTNHISFDLETAIRLRDNLNECIEFARRQSGSTGQAQRGA